MSSGVVSSSAGVLVGMVCDVCRAKGFSVEHKAEEKSNANFVDIVAVREQDEKKHRVVFECWERDVPVDVSQIDGFRRRLRDMNLASGIFVSARGFTPDAEFIARKNGVELWDLARLKEQLHGIQVPDRTEVVGTLPVSKTLSSAIFSPSVRNGRALKLRSLPRLEFRPYYFGTFNVGSGERKARGIIVLDGVDGRACDAKMVDGRLDRLPETGFFMDCLQVEPLTGHLPTLPDELGMSGAVTVAPAGLKREAVGVMVQLVLQTEAGVAVDSVTVTDVEVLHVPIVTVELGAGRKIYRKIVQGATGRTIWDETAHCVVCRNSSVAVCEVCGGVSCSDHDRVCSSCWKHVCQDCAVVKGVLGKKALCPSCAKS